MNACEMNDKASVESESVVIGRSGGPARLRYIHMEMNEQQVPGFEPYPSGYLQNERGANE